MALIPLTSSLPERKLMANLATVVIVSALMNYNSEQFQILRTTETTLQLTYAGVKLQVTVE